MLSFGVDLSLRGSCGMECICGLANWVWVLPLLLACCVMLSKAKALHAVPAHQRHSVLLTVEWSSFWHSTTLPIKYYYKIGNTISQAGEEGLVIQSIKGTVVLLFVHVIAHPYFQPGLPLTTKSRRSPRMAWGKLNFTWQGNSKAPERGIWLSS